MLAYTIFVQLQSLVVISTHADRQSVDMSITVCLFVNLSLCTVTDFSAGDKASGVKFCTMVRSWASWACNLPFWGTLLLQKPQRKEVETGGCRECIGVTRDIGCIGIGSS